MARHSTSSVGADLETATRLNALQQAIADMDSEVATISDSANTIFQATEPATADMESGYVYIWPDDTGDLVVGGLDSDTGEKTIINLEVSAGSDGGLVGGIVGGLL